MQNNNFFISINYLNNVMISLANKASQYFEK